MSQVTSAGDEKRARKSEVISSKHHAFVLNLDFISFSKRFHEQPIQIIDVGEVRMFVVISSYFLSKAVQDVLALLNNRAWNDDKQRLVLPFFEQQQHASQPIFIERILGSAGRGGFIFYIHNLTTDHDSFNPSRYHWASRHHIRSMAEGAGRTSAFPAKDRAFEPLTIIENRAQATLLRLGRDFEHDNYTQLPGNE